MEEYKGYKVGYDGIYSMVEVTPIGRGSVPKSLRGTFTSIPFAKKAIDAIQEKKRGKNKNDSGV